MDETIATNGDLSMASDILPTLLTPIPEEHLISGLATCESEGKVAFGSRAFETFEKADALRGGLELDVFIYPSGGTKFGPPKARWHGIYIGHAHSVGGAHPEGLKYRPATTEQYPDDNQGHWAVFYELANLRELHKGDALAMPRFRRLGSQQRLVSSFVPRGPILVDLI